MRGYPINYTLQLDMLEPYKNTWITKTINIGRCLSEDEAINKGFNALAQLKETTWKNLTITNERNKEIFACPHSAG